LVELLDEHGALGAQALHHGLVVHDLVADVDGRAVERERPLDDLDGALDARAEAARIGEEDFHGGYFRTRPPADSPAAPGVSAWRRRARMTSAARTVIAASATLNAGQCHPKAWKSRKSTTCPSRRRSIALPTAPPRMRARPAQRSLRPGERTRRTATTTE